MHDRRFVNSAIAVLLVLSVSITGLSAQRKSARKPAAAQKPAISEEIKSALDKISADSLRGHLSFIASDLLEGRNTPSPGLELAAIYIAAQMRRAGLEPAGDDGYFQTANWIMAERDMDNFELKIQSGGETINVEKDRVTLPPAAVLELANAPVFKLDYKELATSNSIAPEMIAGRVIMT